MVFFYDCVLIPETVFHSQNYYSLVCLIYHILEALE